jgi:hypothetical protein
MILSPRLRSSLLAATLLATLAGCDDTPTTAVVENGYPPAAGGGATTVFQAWWSTTLFPAPVVAGATSELERTVPASDFAYALLAPGWSPDAAGAPPRLVAVRSAEPLAVAAHERLRIVVSPDTFVGDCATGPPLDADDARLIVERIYPGAFAGATYDPATCTSTRSGADAGSDGDAGAGAEAGP